MGKKLKAKTKGNLLQHRVDYVHTYKYIDMHLYLFVCCDRDFHCNDYACSIIFHLANDDVDDYYNAILQ